MEHRHIPAAKDGSIPDAKTRFRRGQDIFLEDVWYGRCAICGELIERAILTFGRWQEFPTGLKAKQLQFRSDRKSQKRIFIWFGISLTFYFAYFALICFFRR